MLMRLCRLCANYVRALQLFCRSDLHPITDSLLVLQVNRWRGHTEEKYPLAKLHVHNKARTSGCVAIHNEIISAPRDT